MKLQIGKRYRTRNGVVTPPLEPGHNGTSYRFTASIVEPEYGADSPSVRSWTEEGYFLANGSPHRLDIVEEYAPLSKIPEFYTCPTCKVEGELYPIVEGTKHLRHSDFSATGSFEEGKPPNEQCVRLFCETCDVCLPITDTLARELQLQAETT